MEVEGNATKVEATDANATETQETQVDTTQETAAQVNDRLLKEAKAYKARAQAAEREIELQRKKALEEQGKYKEMYESQSAKYNDLKKGLAREKIKSSVAEVAAKAGCLNVDALLKLGNPEMLSFDEDTLAVEGAQEFVEAAKREHSYLFSSNKTASVNGVTPGGSIPQPKKIDGKAIAKMDKDSKAKAWLDAFKAGQ